jgi:predicted ribosomally synthesized peptide with nif11-like leader
MSIESAKAFLERVENDEDFRKSVGELGTAEERMEFVKKAGFDFTKEEINSIKVELSDEDLDKVKSGDVWGLGLLWLKRGWGSCSRRQVEDLDKLRKRHVMAPVIDRRSLTPAVIGCR